jgi:predicted acyl esterase
LHLTPSGGLVESAAPRGKVDYAYVSEVGSQQRGGFDLAGEPAATWNDRPPDRLAATFTTPALVADKVLLGSASLDLLVSSTAADTDFEVTLSEVRPDGQEIFVQQGWLRASHRKEDSDRSTVFRPFQTHQLLDVQPLVPGQPTPMRVEVFPFGHVFRAGSKLRITVAAPHVWPDLWGFVSLPVPAVNSIHTGPGGSSLVLPLVAAAEAGGPLPPCTLRNQPCRPE